MFIYFFIYMNTQTQNIAYYVDDFSHWHQPIVSLVAKCFAHMV